MNGPKGCDKYPSTRRCAAVNGKSRLMIVSSLPIANCRLSETFQLVISRSLHRTVFEHVSSVLEPIGNRNDLIPNRSPLPFQKPTRCHSVFSDFPAINAKTKVGMVVALPKLKLKRPTLGDVVSKHFVWRVWTHAVDNSGDLACALVGRSNRPHRRRFNSPAVSGRGDHTGYQLVDR